MKKRTRRFSLRTAITNEQLAVVTGGDTIYVIGDRRVSKQEYKDYVQDATGRPSQY